MNKSSILNVQELGMPWATIDPFLFCVYHNDHYPKGNSQFGPDASLAGRALGSDFAGKDGWRMYHGETVPGFPSHPHRGFETVTVVRKGLIDHSDSLGAAARFGGGDAQWLTAGRGIVHAEMFPLLERNEPNPLEFFQIWLNLPARSKMAAPYFTMFWGEDIPRHTFADAKGRETEVVCVAGQLQAATSGATITTVRQSAPAMQPAPPPDSWASDPRSDLAIWTVKMAPLAKWTLPPTYGEGTRRTLYFFNGASVLIDGESVRSHCAIELDAHATVELENGTTASDFLMLQGQPLGEPVARYGPFVMNTEQEIRQAFDDYRRDEFGGWPWPDSGPVHGASGDRFAKHANGRVEAKPAKG